MSDRDLEGEFERRAKQAFDRSAAELDAAMRSRLTQARYRALAELRGGAPRLGWRQAVVPAGVLATAAIAAWLVFAPGQGPAPPEADLQAASPDDLELLLGEEDLDMLNEEIEFYAWLEGQPEFAQPAKTGGDGVG